MRFGDLGVGDIGPFVINGFGAVAGDWINVFGVRICKLHCLFLFDNVSGTDTLLLLRGEWKPRKSISFDVIRSLDVMKDGPEFFAQHSPSQNSIGCDGVPSEINVIGADIHLGTP